MSQNKVQKLNKISQILLYSQNYAAHTKILNQIKPCVDSISPQRNAHNKQLVTQYGRYTNAVKRLKDQELNQSNRKLSQKLVEISRSISKDKAKLQNQKSITIRSLWNLKTAKQRQRTKEQKQLSLQNSKMEVRIAKSRSKQNFGLQSYYKQKAQTLRDLNIRGEYSQRSQSVLENLVYNDLKMNSRNIPFLPLLAQRQKSLKKGKQKGSVNSEKKYFKTNFQRQNLCFQREMNFRL